MAAAQPPTVVRLRRRKDGTVVQDCDLYIGRACFNGGWQLPASAWANPFPLPPKATAEQRADVLARYEAHVRADAGLMASVPTLGGARLGCWCHPKPCHGDVLVKLWRELQGAV